MDHFYIIQKIVQIGGCEQETILPTAFPTEDAAQHEIARQLFGPMHVRSQRETYRIIPVTVPSQANAGPL